jgi:murein DD-endopeptidase MepM/ murein hydrolase activator NlpD
MMTSQKTLALTIASILFAGAVFSRAAENATSTPASLTRDELSAQIQTKSKQLDDINQQIESTKASLKDTTTARKTLQNELNTIQNNVNQLSLGIKSDEVTVQKLALEIESLGYDMRDIQESMASKRDAVERSLVELQKNDRENKNLLTVFLKNASLADGVLEAQNLKNLQGRLAADIVGLRMLHEEYNSKINDSIGKKDDITVHQQSLQNKKLIVEDQKEERAGLLAETKNKESEYQKQVTSLEKLQQQIANEVEALGAVLRTKIDPSLLPPLAPGVLGMPISATNARDALTQGYGATEFAKNGYVGHWHNGVDFGVPLGTPILAAEDGTVAAVGNQDSYCYRGAYGKFVVIQHTNNLTTLYGHLSQYVVQKGGTIKRGQVIGYSGKTGYATGPHLHFTVFASPTFYMGPSKVCGPMPFGGDLNPLGYL